MELDAAALANALREEEAAKANLSAIQAEYDRAQELGRRTSDGGIFSALANNAVRTRNLKKANELKPLLKQAREQAASTYGTRDLYDAKVQADERQYERGRDAQADQRALSQAAAAAEQERLAAEREATAFRGDGELYQNAETGEEVMGYMTKRYGPVDAEGNPLGRGFLAVQSTPGGGGGGGGASPSTRRNAERLLNNRDAIESIATTASEFTPTELKELQNIRARFGKQLASEMTPQAWTQMMQGELDDYTPRIRKFMNQVRRLNAEERNRLFGSALTETEVATSEGFMPGAQGLALDDIMLRLSEMDRAYRSGLENIDLINNTNYLTAKEYNAMSDWEKARADREAAKENAVNAANEDANEAPMAPDEIDAFIDAELGGGQ